jgi:hypothetical protein
MVSLLRGYAALMCKRRDPQTEELASAKFVHGEACNERCDRSDDGVYAYKAG